MPTNKYVLQAMKRIAKKLESLGVKNDEDFSMFKRHIGQQGRQIAWEEKKGKWVQHKTWKYGKKKP